MVIDQWRGWGAVAALGALTMAAILTSCSPSSSPAPSSSAAAVDQLSSADLAIQNRPAAQKNIDNLLRTADQAEQGNGNEIVDDMNFRRAYAAYCSAMQSTGDFNSWVAHVRGITAPSDIMVDTPSAITLMGTVDPQSPLYQTLLALKEGDAVRVSGHFSHETADCDFRPFENGERPTLELTELVQFTAISTVK